MPLILDSPSPSPPRSVADDISKRRIEHHSSDVVVIGAGILGTAVAVAFARQGRSVTILEKSLKQPDRIVGELLQPGGVEALKKLGLGECLEDIDACVVKGYEVIYYGTPVLIPYPENAVTKGRPEGRAFHHGRFIAKLRTAVMREPNIHVVESTATELVRNGYTGEVLGVQSLTHGEKDYYFGALTVVADGYASKFRKEFISRTPVVKSKFWGMELIDCDLPSPGFGHVVLGDGAPVLLYQIGTHETRVLVDIPEGLTSASTANGGVKGHMKKVVLPSLPKSIQPSFAAALEEGKLRSMPNSWLPPTTQRTPGMVILGDAMNMRHPLTGGGMTVAFNDAVLVSELLHPSIVPDLGDSKLVIKQMRTFHWRRKGLTSIINILAMALYSLFAADGKQFSVRHLSVRILMAASLDSQLKALQLGCFQYFQRGGDCIDGPCGLLAGIIRQPLVLFNHFFSVAFLAIWINITRSLIWRLPIAFLEGFAILWKACVVIFPYIFSEMTN